MYHIKTLNGLAVLKDFKIEQDDKNQYYPVFEYNLHNDSLKKQQIIKSVNRHADCALFYQLDRLIEKQSESVDPLNYTHIFFVDFQELFWNYRKAIDESNNQKHEKRLSKLQWTSDDNIGWRLRSLLSEKKNFRVCFDGENFYNYVPFDKSNNMARDCCISFIREDYKDDLDERLFVGVDFSNIKVSLSKYYSYRGLYLTTGYRVSDDERLTFSEDTVIILDDWSDDTKECEVYTAKATDDPENWEFGNEPQKLKINCFDGEGLVSPLYAKYINEELRNKYKLKGEATSFQIRMPFTKGMLHTVDFHRFIREELGYGDRKVIVKDMFGVKRDLTKAQIIMTKSMFKMGSWLKKRPENTYNHAMKDYFKSFKDFDHALYITGLDTRLRNHGQVPLNGQFLCTLQLDGELMEGLLKGYMGGIKRIEKDFIKEGESLLNKYEELDEDQIDDTQTDEDGIKPEERENVWDKCKAAVAQNPRFFRNPYVKWIIRKEKVAFKKEIGFGHITVLGQQRYLSADLLTFLTYIGKRIVGLKTDKERKIGDHFADRLGYHEFYMPEGEKNLLKTPSKKGKPYGFLRNPHLSRNEQCILFRSNRESDIYQKYFSHLTGIVMVPYKSHVPMILGGADYDGDLVKVISDRRIVDAIISGVYKIDDSKKRLTRKLPIVSIPSCNSNELDIPAIIPYSVLVNTFSNDIGKISNAAMELSGIQYFSEDDATKKEDWCSQCTIVTGMEIDAAKTGIHPRKNIQKLVNLSKKKGSGRYLGFREFLKKEKWVRNYSFIWVSDDSGDYISLKVGEYTLQSKLPIYKDGDKVSNVERLPSFCVRMLCELKISRNRDSKIEADHKDGTEYSGERGSRKEADYRDGSKYLEEREHRKGTGHKEGPEYSEERAPRRGSDYKDGPEHSGELDSRDGFDYIDAARKIQSWYFAFEKDKSWRRGLDDSKKREVAQLVAAYLHVRSISRKLSRYRKQGKADGCMGILYNILKNQYGSFDTVLPTNMTARHTLLQARQDVREQITDVTTAEKALDVLADRKWHLLPEEERSELADSIINPDFSLPDVKLSSDTLDFISEFRRDGYMILYYLICDVMSELKSEIPIDAYIDLDNDKKIKGDNPYFSTLYEIYRNSDDNKETDSICNEKMIDYCRKKLSECFIEMEEAIKYVWCIRNEYDKFSTFFWNVFTKEEIVQAINGFDFV